ncbi:MAG: hypothetical protein WCF18_15645 [Chthoniobacteraceae bacterium]
MNHSPFVLLAAVALLVGCANPGSTYAAKHPELPPAHRQILMRGKIPNGDAVAGMTREQVKVAMGGDPTTFDKVSNEDVWIYARKKAVGQESFEDLGRSGSSRMENTHSFTQSDDFSPRVDVEMKTTIFFQGDRATHVQSTEANQ